MLVCCCKSFQATVQGGRGRSEEPRAAPVHGAGDRGREGLQMGPAEGSRNSAQHVLMTSSLRLGKETGKGFGATASRLVPFPSRRENLTISRTFSRLLRRFLFSLRPENFLKIALSPICISSRKRM